MPVKIVEPVDRRFVRGVNVPDVRGLAAMLEDRGRLMGQQALNRGQGSAATWMGLAQAFGAYQDAVQQRNREALLVQQREQERQAAEQLKRDEMAMRSAERGDVLERQKQLDDRQARMDTEKRGDTRAAAIGYGPMAESDVDLVMQSPERAGDVRYAFGPGTADGPELQPTREQARGIAVEKAVAGLGGMVGPNGQVVMPPKETKTALRPQPAIVNGKRTFVNYHSDTGTFTDMTGRPVDAQPIPPQGPTGGEPLEAVIGADGNPELVPRSQAVGKRPATSREQPTEDERKSAGFYKQMEDAIKTMDEVEDQLTEQDLYQIQSLPQEDLIGLANRGQMSNAAKRYLRAFEQYTEARLRPVSGAAIGGSEFARDRRTYARQYSETPELKGDRKRARSGALDSLKTRGGRALPKGDSAPANKDPLGIRK